VLRHLVAWLLALLVALIAIEVRLSHGEPHRAAGVPLRWIPDR
jgi:hypothetical protein